MRILSVFVAPVLCALPLLLLIVRLKRNELGPNPIEELTHVTGDWTLWFLLLSLSITPLRKLLQFPQLIRFRRTLGLAAFFYGLAHFSIWFWFDKALMLGEMSIDIAQRPFLTVGMLGLALMVPLALTSTAWSIRKLGGKRWQKLHRLVYVSAIAGVVHYYWLVKSDVSRPLWYGGILAVLLLLRVIPLPRMGGTPRPTSPSTRSTSSTPSASSPR